MMRHQGCSVAVHAAVFQRCSDLIGHSCSRSLITRAPWRTLGSPASSATLKDTLALAVEPAKAFGGVDLGFRDKVGFLLVL